MKNVYLIIVVIVFLILTLPTAFFAQSKKIIKPPKELINAYFSSAQGKEELQKHYQGDYPAAAKDLIVTAINIDRDRKPEYFIKHKSFCNGQDCLVTLYKQRGGTFVKLLSAQNLDIGEESGKGGIRNLKSCSVDSSGVAGVCSYYQWDKNQYVIFKCMKAESDKSKLKAKIVPCSII